MSGHDEFYGLAIREFESGERRDGLWGKAFAQAKGDVQKANGLYVEMLASTLAREAGVPAPLPPAAVAVNVARGAGKLMLSIFVSILFAGLAGSLTKSEGAAFAFLLAGAAVSWYLLWSKESPLKSKSRAVTDA